jgi:hypothetical protein
LREHRSGLVFFEQSNFYDGAGRVSRIKLRRATSSAITTNVIVNARLFECIRKIL